MKVRRRKMRAGEEALRDREKVLRHGANFKFGAKWLVSNLRALPLVKRGSWAFAGHLETVGGQYAEYWEAKMDGLLQEGSVIVFKREPSNVHDKCAIAVYAGDYRIGYVPRENYLLAAIMDVGVNVAGRVLLPITNGVKLRLYVGVPKK